VSSVFSESFRPANASSFAEVCPPKVRARGYVLNRMAINLGVTIGPAVGGFLATISYSYLFWVDGITCILAAIVFWFLFHEKKYTGEHNSENEASTFVSPYKDKVFLTMMIFLFGLGLCFVQLFNTWPLYHKEVYGFDEDVIGILLAINAFTVVLIEMPLIRRLEKTGTFAPMIIGAFLLFAGFSILPYGNGFAFAVFAVMVWTIGEILIFPLMSTYIANRASDKTRGKYMGLYTFTFSFAFIIGPIIGTYFYQIEKSMMFYIMQVVGIITTLAFILLARKVQRNNKSMNLV
jgi:MFS family permease